MYMRVTIIYYVYLRLSETGLRVIVFFLKLNGILKNSHDADGRKTCCLGTIDFDLQADQSATCCVYFIEIV